MPWLKADYDVECFTGTHARKHMVLGVVGVVLYPIGIPLFTAFLLLRDGKTYPPPLVPSSPLHRATLKRFLWDDLGGFSDQTLQVELKIGRV